LIRSLVSVSMALDSGILDIRVAMEFSPFKNVPNFDGSSSYWR
jgi:hypothetical protein